MSLLDELPVKFWDYATRLIAIDSSIVYGNLAVVNLYQQLFKDWQLNPRIWVQPMLHQGVRHANLMASFGPQTSGGLLLVTHSDTVLSGPLDRWTETAPWTLKNTGEKVYGLGVADVKLDYLCKALAISQVDQNRLKKPVHLLATCAEEVGLLGAKHVVQDTVYWPQIKPDYVLCGEPSELIPCHAHKGYAVIKLCFKWPNTASNLNVADSYELIVEITAKGRAAHSSTPHLGQNAIIVLAEFLNGYSAYLIQASGGHSANAVPALARAVVKVSKKVYEQMQKHASSDVQVTLLSQPSEEKAFAQTQDFWTCVLRLWQQWNNEVVKLLPNKDEEFNPNTAVCNFGQMQCHAQQVELVFDARLLPAQKSQILIQEFIKQCGLLYPEINIEHAITRDNPGMRLSPQHPLILALCDVMTTLGYSVKAKAKPTSTEAGVFVRAGFDAAVFGPGVSVGNAHCANECNDVAQLALAVKAYQGLIEKLCM